MNARKFSAIVIISASLTSVAPVAYPQTSLAGSAAAGRTLALQACTGCHVVAADQPFKPIYKGLVRPPDFSEIAQRPGVTAASLQHHLETLPTIPANSHMANPALTSQQVRDIVAFIVSLRGK